MFRYVYNIKSKYKGYPLMITVHVLATNYAEAHRLCNERLFAEFTVKEVLTIVLDASEYSCRRERLENPIYFKMIIQDDDKK